MQQTGPTAVRRGMLRFGEVCHGLRLQSACRWDGPEEGARGELRRGHGDGEASAGNHGCHARSAETDNGEESYTSLSQ